MKLQKCALTTGDWRRWHVKFESDDDNTPMAKAQTAAQEMKDPPMSKSHNRDGKI